MGKKVPKPELENVLKTVIKNLIRLLTKARGVNSFIDSGRFMKT